MLKDIESHDWMTNDADTGTERKLKSIQEYHLKPNSWYEKIKDLTFDTQFFSEIPYELPYDKCMVRWENKSPKDSDYWGPVWTSIN